MDGAEDVDRFPLQTESGGGRTVTARAEGAVHQGRGALAELYRPKPEGGRCSPEACGEMEGGAGKAVLHIR